MRTRTRPRTAPLTCTRRHTVEIDGSTGNHYTVRFTPDGTSCTCKGYVYRGRCRHQSLGERRRCTWTSRTGTPETTPGSCPACGAATTPDTAAVTPLNPTDLLRTALLTLLDMGAGEIVLYDDGIEIGGPDDVVLASWPGTYTRPQLARLLGIPVDHIVVDR